MKCFKHIDKDAVGICKSCGKGLCPECATVFQKGLACKEECEEEVQALIILGEKSKTVLKKTSRTIYASGILFFSIGGFLAFISLGIEETSSKIPVILFAFLSFGYALNSLRIARKIDKPEE